MRWRLGGSEDGEPVALHFLFDLGWGHTGIPDVNINLWRSQFPLVYEVDYSRVYVR
jgi:hypothetical protein